jgi:hypothetical protein
MPRLIPADKFCVCIEEERGSNLGCATYVVFPSLCTRNPNIRKFHSGSANLDGNVMLLCEYENCSEFRTITPGGLLYNGGRELYNEELHGL